MLEIRKHAFRCDDTRRGDVYEPFLLHRQGGGAQGLHFAMVITSSKNTKNKLGCEAEMR